MVGFMESAGDGVPGGSGDWLAAPCAVEDPDAPVFGSICTFNSIVPFDWRGMCKTFTV